MHATLHLHYVRCSTIWSYPGPKYITMKNENMLESYVVLVILLPKFWSQTARHSLSFLQVLQRNRLQPS